MDSWEERGMIAWIRTQKSIDELRRVQKNGTTEEYLEALDKAYAEKKIV